MHRLHIKPNPNLIQSDILAGKGRTGTLACAYLLSTGQAASPPKLKRSYSDRQWALLTADKLVRALDSDDSDPSDSETASKKSQVAGPSNARTSIKVAPALANDIALNSDKANISQTSLDAILDLHSSRRMKVPEKEDAKRARGGGCLSFNDDIRLKII